MKKVRLAKNEDLGKIAEIFQYAREMMAKNGNPTQWGDSRPSMKVVEQDIANQNFYVVEEDGKIQGVFAFIIGHDVTYDVIEEGAWRNDDAYGVIHRIAAGPGASGVLQKALEYANTKISNIRIDTHRDNKIMQYLLTKYGFTYCGIIYTDDGTKRLAFHKTEEDSQSKL